MGIDRVQLNCRCNSRGSGREVERRNTGLIEAMVVQSHLPPLQNILFFVRDAKTRGPFYLMSTAGKVKYPTQAVDV